MIATVLAWVCELSFLGPCAMDQLNLLTLAELKRCGIAPIEHPLQHGPVRRSKRNRSVALFDQ